ncbi:MAG: hypothetical protein O7C75_07050 [Verrucomicrobia bacterium]|nr:hypothetical protein [Verrucomicrobiota bacterium]
MQSLKSFCLLAIRLGAILMLYMVLDGFLRRISHLPESSYRQPVIIFELVERLVDGSWLSYMATRLLQKGFITLFVGVFAITFFVVLGIRYRAYWQNFSNLMCQWSGLVDGIALRWLIVTITLLPTWLTSTYDFNLYFNQAHYADRFLLLLLGVLVAWRPIFVFPFILLLLAIFNQFSYPFEGNPSWTELNLLVRALTLFGSTFLIWALTKRANTKDFIFLLCCLVASCYWGSGIGKFQLNWISHPHLHLLFFGAFANGWLGFCEPSTIVTLSKFFSHFTIPFMLFTLVIEWGALLLLWKRWSFLGFLGGFILFHIGIFFITGMFFWKWMVLEGALITYFVWNNEQREIPIFSWSHFTISVVIIGGSLLWFYPRNLSWYDTPVTYVHRIEGVGESGTRYHLTPQTFTPYSDLFTLGPFSFLSKYPQLTHIWGISGNIAIAEKLVNLTSPKLVFALEKEMGQISFDETAANNFEEFMAKFIGNLNERRSKRTVLSILQPPPHLWTFPKQDISKFQERLVKVSITEVTFLYDGDHFRSIRERHIRDIHIPVVGGQ